eukprot:COSAG05_NODE_273_length_12440_cov_22.182805_11_plen_302_part_00
MAAAEMIGRLASPSAAEVQAALVAIQSLALDDGDALISAGGPAALCAVLGRPDAVDTHLRDAALCLFLLMEEDPQAVQAVVAAGGAHALTCVLNRRNLPPATAEWVASAIDCLPIETLALASRGARLSTMDAVALAAEEQAAAERAALEKKAQGLGTWKLMRRTIPRAAAELDSKRGATLDPGLVFTPIASVAQAHGFVRLQLPDGHWVSECGMDGNSVCERVCPSDGLTDSERAEHTRLEQLAAEETAHRERLQAEAERRAAFLAEEAEKRRKMEELVETFRECCLYCSRGATSSESLAS